MRLLSRRALLSTTVPLVRAAARKPNLVFLYSDDQGAWTLGRSNRQARTPHVDGLCRDGVSFANSFVTTPVCSPSRASLMTSRYALEVGIEDYLAPQEDAAIGLSHRFPVWPKALREAGYRTGLVGKWHLGYRPEFHPTRYGFEYFAGFVGGGSGPMDPSLEVDGVTRQFQGSTPDIFTDHALAFIRAHRREPFALYLHYREPHASNAPGGGTRRTWLPLPDEDWAPFEKLDPVVPNPDFDNLDVPQVKRMMREYLASCACLDRNVGRVLAELSGLGLAEDTIVVFTSDNGMNMGHNGIWHKGNGRWILKGNQGNRPNLYDNSLRVPAVIRFPGRARAGITVNRTITNLDWFPTLLSLTGTPMPKEAQIRGRDLTPLLSGRAMQWDDELYAEYNMRHSAKADLRAWRTAEWKMVRDLRNPGRDELYHLQLDPAETRNLIHSTDSAVQRARAELERKLAVKIKQLDGARG
ncbi:MAG: sulfatase-like hydrolase/transferase [Bryobacteraceae bacterium]|nr:sulfatase-like hydrolase/transferase [Bryobacteraceae bacterium]